MWYYYLLHTQTYTKNHASEKKELEFYCHFLIKRANLHPSSLYLGLIIKWIIRRTSEMNNSVPNMKDDNDDDDDD